MRPMLIVAGCLMAALPLGWIAANGVSSPARGKEPRFPQLIVDQLSDQQRPVAEQILKVSSVGIGGPYNPILRSPVYAQRMVDLLDYLRWHTSMPIRSTRWRSSSSRANGARKWNGSRTRRSPKKAGLPELIIADLKASKRPASMSAEQEAVYDFVTELTTKRAVSDDVYDRAKKLLGEQQVVDLTGVVGTYVGVAMMLAMAEQGVPADKEPPFKDGEP